MSTNHHGDQPEVFNEGQDLPPMYVLVLTDIPIEFEALGLNTSYDPASDGYEVLGPAVQV